jgi:esterase/lipase superfamily enzyme
MSINREYHRWWSPRLHRDMELLVFGHDGAKVLVFPTRDGRFHEYEDIRMTEALRLKLEAGHLQLYCVDSLAPESLYCREASPPERVRRLRQYEEYLLCEVLPFMEARNPHECVTAHGCSLGAYHAANVAFRHPARFRKLAAFSGRYDLTQRVEEFPDLFDGHYDEDIYFHTPLHFLPNLASEAELSALRRMDILLVIGDEDPFLESNRTLHRILEAKGIPHRLEIWRGRAHQGHAWRKMAQLYL